MKLGVISDYSYRVTDLDREWSLSTFSISPSSLSFHQLFHSAFATPARYVQEIFLRLYSLDTNEVRSSKFVFNPLFDSTQLDILLVLAALKELPPFDGIIILTDVNGLSAGYLFPPWLETEDANFLALLSCVNGHVDATLCGLLFQTETRCVCVSRLTLSRAQHNGFLYKEDRDIYLWVAERAIARLRTAPSRSGTPFTAVMPYHAGDVLFFALAFNETPTQIERIAVHRAYRDIVDDNAPSLDILSIDAPLINRSDDIRLGKVTPEGTYFHSIKDQLPEDSFYVYLRPSRDYNVSLFHLIDHFAFALGGRFFSVEDLPAKRMHYPNLFQPESPANVAARILLHFDGGWPLKVYPRSQQDRLIEQLHAEGYGLTVLAQGNNNYSNCAVTTFQGYPQLKELLQAHHLLIGMDSFPAHYAAHVLGLPTICLFASTRPANSDAPVALNYSFLEEGLRCRPCYGIARCPLYGGSDCRNFVSPETVVTVVKQMLGGIRKEKEHRPSVIGLKSPDGYPPGPAEQPAKVKNISLSHLQLKVVLYRAFSPYWRYLLLLYREFSSAVRREGFLHACLRALRFLRKIVSR